MASEHGGGELVASPMTYELEGRLYLLIPVQDVLYAFSLPEKTASRATSNAKYGGKVVEIPQRSLLLASG
jgi:hypothetical protein